VSEAQRSFFENVPAPPAVDSPERRAEDAEHAFVAERAARREAETSAERFQFLSEASALLAASLDEEAIVANLAHLGVAMLSDWCAVDLVDAGSHVRRAAIASEPVTPVDEPSIAPTTRPHADLAARVLSSGRSIVERYREASMRPGARLGVPLIAQGRCLGVVLFVTDLAPDRLHGTAGIALAEELARHAASALANARLYAELAEQRAQVGTILESISDAFFAVDRAWRFTYLNKEAERLMRRPARELLGMRLWDGFAPGNDRFATELQRAMTERVTVSFVEQHAPYHAWLEVRGFPATDGVAVYFRDVTDERLAAEKRRRLQESLRISERMSAIGAVAAGVAHEVRNPLFGLSSTLDALQSSFPDRGELEPFIGTLRQQTGRLGRLMSDLLEYGKPSVDERMVAPLGDVLGRAIAHCEPMGESAGVHLRSDFDRLALPAIPIDRDRFTRAVQNLLENAIQHSPRGGVVRLAAGVVDTEDGQWVECHVVDNGVGIAPANLPRLFEPFFTKRHGGTGLGLSIADRIVREHGGTVVAANAPEGGAVVTVRIPLGVAAVSGQ
jgi:PAS domain S-box-containing protein